MDIRQGLMKKAFFLYSVALALLMMYAVLDYQWELESIEKTIDELRLHLQKLSRRRDASFNYDKDIYKILGQQVHEAKRCDLQRASLRLGQAIRKKKIKNPLKIWEEVARPSILLHAEKMEASDENSESKESRRITGWRPVIEQCCSGIHPVLRNRSRVEIMMSGNYYVFSQLPLFRHDGIKNSEVYRHVVEMKEYGDSEVFQLMINSFQFSSKPVEVSYQAGVFYLDAGSILQVSMTSPLLNQHIEKFGVRDRMEFGLYLL
uniref:uncharacterized protein LOC120335914 isoform X2 n=1 Tax=Styela clava TaxID=7725 RepID=UPI001939DFB4|nr:uncharacterized protein LOC120335914 isoform X2 [Styela clava]